MNVFFSPNHINFINFFSFAHNLIITNYARGLVISLEEEPFLSVSMVMIWITFRRFSTLLMFLTFLVHFFEMCLLVFIFNSIWRLTFVKRQRKLSLTFLLVEILYFYNLCLEESDSKNLTTKKLVVR